jgi:hypothetical protein
VTLILGIDPGAHGAFVVYDMATRGMIDVKRMPTWTQLVGKTKRQRVDPLALADMFDVYGMMGVDLIVMEAVGGRGKQPGSSGFVFGFGVGMVYAFTVMAKIPVETIAPHTWKAMLRVPGKMRADDSAIIQRAGELFPYHRHLFVGPKGGNQVDVAEAAMLAMFGGDHILKSGVVTLDPAHDLAYRKRPADVGA